MALKVSVHGLKNKRSAVYGAVGALVSDGFQVCLGVQNNDILEAVQPLAERWGREPTVEGRGWIQFAQVCDVTDGASMSEYFARVQTEMGSLDGLVHSIAGGSRRSVNVPLMRVPQTDFEKTMQVSAFSLVALCQCALECLNTGALVIYFTFSPGSQGEVQNYKLMGAGKAALEKFGDTLAVELGENDKRIRVIGLDLAPLETDSAHFVRGFEQYRQAYAKTAPLGETTLEDVGNVVSLCFDPRFASVTGAIIPVTRGGHLLVGMPTKLE